MTNVGLTGLSASGLSAYFAPKYIEGEKSSNLIFAVNSSDVLNRSEFLELISQEKEKLGKLRDTHSELKKVLNGIERTKQKTHGEVDNQLQTVAKEEQELAALYEKIQEMIGLLEKLEGQRGKVLNRKLESESLVEALKYYNSAMFKAGSTMTQWGGAISQILCALKDSSGQKDCTKEKKWLVREVPTTDQSVSGQSSSISTAKDTEGGAVKLLKKQKFN